MNGGVFMRKTGTGLLLLWLGMSASMAQQADRLQKDSLNVERQIPLTYYDKIQPTESEKYVIVYKDSLCGIYDVKDLRNVTDIKYTNLRVRNREMSDIGAITVFVYECGEQHGLISLCEANNEYVSIEL